MTGEKSASISELLFNEAFCGALLYAAMDAYCSEADKEGIPILLCYLILPMALTEEIANSINSRAKFLTWIQRNEAALAAFPMRCSGFRQLTNRTLLFLFSYGQIVGISDKAEILLSNNRAIKRTKPGSETHACVLKCQTIGRWFARTSSVETVYSMLGVLP